MPYLFESTYFIILTTFSGDAQIVRGLKAGASGYLLKNMARTELVEYVERVHSGESQLPVEVTRSLSNTLLMDSLTVREIDVLKLVGVDCPISAPQRSWD